MITASGHGMSGCGCNSDAGSGGPRGRYVRPAQIALRACRRHLTYHIWPTRQHDEWRWNIEQLVSRWPLFNGRKVLGLVYDYRSHFPDEVLSYCGSVGIEWDKVIIRRNTAKLGEVKTWRERLAALRPELATERDVVFAAHAKGVRHAAGVMRPWVSTMLEACLDDWPTVREQLEWHTMTGCFLQPRDGHRWHYSGSFFWFRWGDIARRNWSSIEGHYSGTETWPWLMCHRNEVGCLYGHNCGDLYTLQGQLREQWEQQRASIGVRVRAAVPGGQGLAGD